MNILVIGGTRLVGKHLVNTLLSNNHQVTIATRGTTRDDFGDTVNRIIFDRYNEQRIIEQLSDKSYDVVYDSLAYASNDIKILLDHIHCQKYIVISTSAVYKQKLDTKEIDFDANLHTLVWCNRNDFPYDETKRQVECALLKHYSHIPTTIVRFPFIIGEDDYTNRLKQYVEHIQNKQPLYINNYHDQLAFISSIEAGQFLAFQADSSFSGIINAANDGTISLREIIEYVENHVHKSVILSPTGDIAAYNNVYENSLNLNKAHIIGYTFSPLKPFIFNLIDTYINKNLKV